MWKLKILIQFVLSHIPFGEEINHFFQRIHRNSKKRMNYTQLQIPEFCKSLKMLREMVNLENAVIVEIGTGWCPVATMLLAISNATIYSYDHIRHVRFNLIGEMLSVLENNTSMIADSLGISENRVRERLSEFQKAQSLEELFNRANIHYIAPGDAANSGLPASSVDIVYSYAVLEHVPEAVILNLIKEAKRVLKASGCFYALIGLHDHYASFDKSISKVNFLKYPEWLWAFWVKNNISYHNRLRECEYINVLKENGAVVKKINHEIDSKDLALCRTIALDARFRNMTPEECAVTKTEIVACFNEVLI